MVFINLDINEIIYDIQNKTYLTGKSRRDGQNHEQVANMQVNDDEENANQVLRSIAMAFSSLKNMLAEYLRLDHTTADNELPASDSSLSLALDMPANYNLSSIDTIAAAAHQYIVSQAVKDWFTITHKSDASEYATLAKESIAAITDAINRRTRPVRKTTLNQKQS